MLAVRVAYPTGTRVQLAVDDTVFYKVGRRIEGVGVFRDAVRSTRKRLVYGLGLNLVVISLRIDPPGEPPTDRTAHLRQGATHQRRAHPGPCRP